MFFLGYTAIFGGVSLTKKKVLFFFAAFPKCGNYHLLFTFDTKIHIKGVKEFAQVRY